MAADRHHTCKNDAVIVIKAKYAAAADMKRGYGVLVLYCGNDRLY